MGNTIFNIVPKNLAYTISDISNIETTIEIFLTTAEIFMFK